MPFTPVSLALVLLLGLAGCGTAAEQELGEEEVLGAQLEALEEELQAAPSVQSVEELRSELASREDELAEVEDQLAEARAERAASVPPQELEEELADLRERLREAEQRANTTEELDAREAQLEEQAADLARRERAAAAAPAPADPAPEPAPADPAPADSSGCAPGQVDVNTASAEDLQRIHQVGPDRAGQIIDLRPFGSLDDLTRVSGIGPAHLSAIKGQGVACAR